MERGVSKLAILTEATRSAHSALNEYVPVISQAARDESEFMAHMIPYLSDQGSIRDANIALPVITLSVPEFNEPAFVDNSLAHLAKLTPRELHVAYKFAMGQVRNKDLVPNPDPAKAKRYPKIRVGGWKHFQPEYLVPRSGMRKLESLVGRYLRSRESNPAAFERNVVQFRRDMQSLYFMSRTAPSEYAKEILYNNIRPCGSTMQAIAELEHMEPRVAAASIVEHRIPFLMLFPILKKKVQDPVLLMAIIDRMSPSELQTNMKMLERLGVKDHPETRAALDQGLIKLASSRKTVLKTTKAAESVTDEKMKAKVLAAQEKQIDNFKGVNGNWLVLGDCSSSMGVAVETAKLVAGTLARFVTDQVALVFFNDSPRYFDVTGKSMDEINQITKYVQANGWTSIGCGVLAAVQKGLDIHGIAIVSDGQENRNPLFVDQYKALCAATGRQIPVYYYKVGASGYSDTLTESMNRAGFSMEVKDLRTTKIDSYSLPALVSQMKVNRFSVLDQVYEYKLLTVDQVLGVESKKGRLVTC